MLLKCIEIQENYKMNWYCVLTNVLKAVLLWVVSVPWLLTQWSVSFLLNKKVHSVTRPHVPLCKVLWKLHFGIQGLQQLHLTRPSCGEGRGQCGSRYKVG